MAPTARGLNHRKSFCRTLVHSLLGKRPMRKPLTILLADNIAADALLLTEAIKVRSAGLVQRVEDGAAAVSYLMGHGPYQDRSRYPFPSMVVLDLVLPKVDGLSLLAWRRQSRRIRALPFLVLTGARGGLWASLRLGANGVFLKPLNSDRFWQAVEAAALGLSCHPVKPHGPVFFSREFAARRQRTVSNGIPAFLCKESFPGARPRPALTS